MSDSTATQRSTGARAVLLVDVPSPPSLPPSPCPLYEFAGLTLPPPPPARRSRAPTRRRAVAHKTIVLSSSPTKACLSLLWSFFSCLSSSLSFSSIFFFSFFFIVFYLPMFSSRPFPPLPFASSVFSSSSMLTSNLSPCFFGFRLLEVPLLRLLHSFLSVVLSVLLSVSPPPHLLSPSPFRPLWLSSYYISLFPYGPTTLFSSFRGLAVSASSPCESLP